jgi:hypothetical protein
VETLNSGPSRNKIKKGCGEDVGDRFQVKYKQLILGSILCKNLGVKFEQNG